MQLLGSNLPAFIHGESDGAPYVVAPGSMPWGESPYGVHDMAGNVAEWVADYYRDSAYLGLGPIAPMQGIPMQSDRSMRVSRGGSWILPKLFGRTYFRRAAHADQRSFDRGFRCAQD
jgi:formylglycine-generating enzyme required for sulfatase activity